MRRWILMGALLAGCGAAEPESGGSVSADTGAQTADAAGSADAEADTSTADAATTDAAVVDTAVSDATDAGAALDTAPDPDGQGGDAGPDGGTDGAGDSTADAGPPGCTPACTMTQVCEAGTCKDVPQPCGGACASGTYCDGTSCQPTACSLPTGFPKPTQKVSFLQIAPSDQGCDLTGDGSSNNVFGKLLKVYPAANTELLKSVQEGLFILLLEADGWDFTGKPFAVNGYLGELDSSNSSCPVTASFGNCKYTVDADNFAGGAAGTVCQPQVRVSPAKVGGVSQGQGLLDAGGTVDQKMTVVLPVVGGLAVTISGVRLDGLVKGASGWSETKKGRICGVMTLADFKKAIDAVPDDAWKEIGLDKATVEAVLAAFLAPAIDVNKDGTPDAISMALQFETVSGSIVKVIP